MLTCPLYSQTKPLLHGGNLPVINESDMLYEMRFMMHFPTLNTAFTALQ